MKNILLIDVFFIEFKEETQPKLPKIVEQACLGITFQLGKNNIGLGGRNWARGGELGMGKVGGA
jgi:hypothetical protein